MSRKLTPSLRCDACEISVDVLSWSRHNKTKDHIRKHDEFEERRRMNNRIRRLERECELRKVATPEDEIQSILDEEDMKEEEAYEEQQRNAEYLEREAVQRKKAYEKERDELIAKKLKEEKEKMDRQYLLEEARLIVQQWEQEVRELLSEDASPTDMRWDVYKRPHPNKYVSNFTNFIEGTLWDDAWNYKRLFQNMVIDYKCSTHVPIYLRGTSF